MGDFLRNALSAIPKAAQNPLALVAYLSAIAAWVFIAARVKRNKSLLANLEKLPAEDRLSALRDEMGNIPIPKSVTASEWLKARNNRYYFWAFMTICFVIIVIVAIASYGTANAAAELKSSARSIAAASESIKKASDPLEAEQRDFDELKLGIQRQYVVSKLGVPQNETKYEFATCAAYTFHKFDVYLIYDNKTQTVKFFSVTSNDQNFHPEIRHWPFDGTICLGCQTFKEISSQFGEVTPLYFDYSSKFWVYTEILQISFAAGQTTIFLTNRNGADYDNPDAIQSGIAEVLTGIGSPDFDFGQFYAQLSPQNRAAFDHYRSNARPNSFAEISDRGVPADKDDLFQLERGGRSSCPEQAGWE